MKKIWCLLALCLLLPLTALAADVPDPETFFGEGGRWHEATSPTYRHVMDRDPKAALTAYVELLQEEYGMTLAKVKSGEEQYYWKLSAKDGTEITVECAVDGAQYYTFVIVSEAVNTVVAEVWDWDKNALAGENVTILPDPETFFGEGGRWHDATSPTYRHVMDRDPKAALTAYVELLQEEYGMTLAKVKSGEEQYYWKLSAKDGTEITVECAVDGAQYYTFVIVSEAVNTVVAEVWDWDKNALAGENVTILPDPETFFGEGGRWHDATSPTYRHVMDRDPKAALTAYVELLQEEYGMTLAKVKSGEEQYYWKLSAKDGTEITVECAVDGAQYYTFVIVSGTVNTVSAEVWDWDRNELAEEAVTVLQDFLQHDTSGK